ncbi:MAG: hypothetical protein AAF193_06960 [Bacteroidota bacterium]
MLRPKVKPFKGSAKVMADQAAAMMIQDARSFLQSNEQIFTVAMAQAAKLLLETQTQQTGTDAMVALNSALLNLSNYASVIGKTASEITYEFDSSEVTTSDPSSGSETSNSGNSEGNASTEDVASGEQNVLNEKSQASPKKGWMGRMFG